jgi:hypothetical protein
MRHATQARIAGQPRRTFMARGEYEPKDSRNVTGTASTDDGRWTNRDGTPPLANGEHPQPQDFDEDDEDDDDELVDFEPDAELERMIEEGRAKRLLQAAAKTQH